MEAPYQPAPDIHVLPTSLPLPGVGALIVNAYVISAEEPVLVDTGLAVDGDAFVDAVESVVALSELRWIWLTHDDADHTGNVQRVVESAPNATLVTPWFGALRMASWWPVPLDRVHPIRPGDELHVGDRMLRGVKPPLYDNPMSTGIFDTSSGALFSVDSFGAILPEAAQDVAEVPDDALAAGMTRWATFDSPWTAIVDREQFPPMLDNVRRMQPSGIFSSHLPAASGDCTDRFLQLLSTVPDAEPFVAPDREGPDQLVAAVAAMATTADGH